MGGFEAGLDPQVACSITGWNNFLAFLFATILNYNGRGALGEGDARAKPGSLLVIYKLHS